MASVFPSLVPESRTYTTGRFRADRRADLSGAQVRFLKGRVATGHRLTLVFGSATELETRQILDHYRSCQSSFISFQLAEVTWCGTDHAIDLPWRYASAPEVSQLKYNLYSLSVQLVSVTTELPARSLAPVASGSTVTVTAQTPPTPPSDPFGTFFAHPDSSLRYVIGGGLSQPNRAFQPEVIVSFSSDVELKFPRNFGPRAELRLDSDILVVYDQNNGQTRQLQILTPSQLLPSGDIQSLTSVPLEFGWFVSGGAYFAAPGGTLVSSGEIAGVTAASIQFKWALSGSLVATINHVSTFVAGSYELLNVTPANLTWGWIWASGSIQAAMPAGAGNGGGEYDLDVLELDVSAFSFALPINFPLDVSSTVDGVDRASVEAQIAADIATGSLVDETSRASVAATVVSPATVGGDADMPRRDPASISALVSVNSTANPSYVDFGTGGTGESTAFAWGPSAGPTDIPFGLTPTSLVDFVDRASVELLAPFSVASGGDHDMPRRSGQSLPVDFSATAGGDHDMPRRLSAETALGFDVQATTSNPAYIDFTSGSTEEDAGFQVFGATQALAVAFNVTVGSLFSPFSRASTEALIPLTVIAGGDVDTPSRSSAGLPISCGATAAGDADTPTRATVQAAFNLEVLATANPAYVDTTSGSTDEDAGFQVLGVTAALGVAFNVTVGSLFSPFTRAGTVLDIAFSITAGGDDDTPRNNSTSLVAELGLTAGGDADMPRRAGSTLTVIDVTPGQTQPTSFSDLTP